MSRKNGHRYQNYMAFMRRSIARQNENPRAAGAGIQNSGPVHSGGENLPPEVEEQICLHKLFATVNCDELLKYARDSYAMSGRGAVTVMGDELANYDADSPEPFAVRLMYTEPNMLEMLPPAVAARAVAMLEKYDAETMFVFLVISTKGASIYTFGKPYWASDGTIDSTGNRP